MSPIHPPSHSAPNWRKTNIYLATAFYQKVNLNWFKIFRFADCITAKSQRPIVSTNPTYIQRNTNKAMMICLKMIIVCLFFVYHWSIHPLQTGQSITPLFTLTPLWTEPGWCERTRFHTNNNSLECPTNRYEAATQLYLDTYLTHHHCTTTHQFTLENDPTSLTTAYWILSYLPSSIFKLQYTHRYRLPLVSAHYFDSVIIRHLFYIA